MTTTQDSYQPQQKRLDVTKLLIPPTLMGTRKTLWISELFIFTVRHTHAIWRCCCTYW